MTDESVLCNCHTHKQRVVVVCPSIYSSARPSVSRDAVDHHRRRRRGKAYKKNTAAAIIHDDGIWMVKANVLVAKG